METGRCRTGVVLRAGSGITFLIFGSLTAEPIAGLVSSSRPSTRCEPTGRCIHEFATMMKSAESQVPRAKSQTVTRWIRRESLSQPKIQSPRKVEHERGEPFDRERRAEGVADELRVDRPVHPELELLHEPRRDPNREIDEHERPEETGQP